MTVIAYRDGCLAADSLVTWRTHRDGHVRKIFKVGRILVTASGTTALAQAFTDWVRSGMDPSRQPAMIQPGAKDAENQPASTGYIFMPDGLIVSLNHTGWEHLRTPIFAAGSGCDYAYGAMAVGASAEDAVRAAIRFDTGCGGEVTVLRH